jgi:hypothetical protein
MLFALLLLAVAIVAIVLATAPASTQIKLLNVSYTDAEKVAEALRQLVSENTK